ncbi:MAG: hypothetical protein JW861_08115 [Bacteroidales bacterium]|nr:hypothetical protein [Bacteroidales bacterium]
MKSFLMLSVFILGIAFPGSSQEADAPGGPCSLDDLHAGDFAAYMDTNYTSYLPDSSTISRLCEKLRETEITVVLGTWCSDTRTQVPRFIRILDDCGYVYEGLTLICVDRKRTAGDIDISSLNIERVPTFIVYFEAREVGRIIETPDQTLEEDLLRILLQ